MVTDNQKYIRNQNHAIDINFRYFNHNVPINEVLKRLHLNKDKSNQYFFFSKEPNEKIKIDAKNNVGFNNEKSKKLTIIDIVCEEKQFTPYQAALYLSIFYPDGIKKINTLHCLKLVTDDFLKEYHINAEKYKNLLSEWNNGKLHSFMLEDINIKQIEFILDNLSLREKELQEEHKSFLSVYKKEHDMNIINEDGKQETIHVKGLNDIDYQYILSVFHAEMNQVQTMYSLFSICYRELMEEKDKINPDKNIFEEFDNTLDER